MCVSHEDEEQEIAETKGHKRNLSSGTTDASPVRRSKRQRSSANLKELSSSEESEAEEDKKPAPAKSKPAKKTQASAATKKVPAAKKAAPEVKTVCQEPAEVKTEPEAGEQKPKPAAKRGKKAKEDKESETMPLAARTKGLKMFVGAHVSAAKGVFNAIHNSEQIG